MVILDLCPFWQRTSNSLMISPAHQRTQSQIVTLMHKTQTLHSRASLPSLLMKRFSQIWNKTQTVICPVRMRGIRVVQVLCQVCCTLFITLQYSLYMSVMWLAGENTQMTTNTPSQQSSRLADKSTPDEQVADRTTSTGKL